MGVNDKPETRSEQVPEMLGWTMPGLSERTVIVTGGGSGIGAATVRALSAAGARVLAVDRDAAGLAEVRAGGENIVTLEADLLSDDAPERIVDAALDAFGRITSLVHIAGVGIWADLDDIDRKHLDTLFGVNVYAPILLTRAAAPHLERTNGQVVFCGSSISAYLGSAGGLGYTATKHAVLGVMRSCVAELGPRGVRVNAVSPGTTVSPINDELFRIPGWLDAVISKNPDGRIAMPHEHAGAVAFLLSDLAKHVHGVDIRVDGGRLA